MTGKTHHIVIMEGSTVEESVDSVVEEKREEFEVVNPLLKNGKKYKPGSKIALTAATAAAFLREGDIKEISND